MKTLISFHPSTDVPPHTVDMSTLPRVGDVFSLPDVGTGGHYRVERVIWSLSRPSAGEKTFEVVEPIRIELGPFVAD